ncbi:MAG: hypothetical protein WC531_02720 [Candidatus Paceibacterota bacterium]|jgi:hypothetical protein
MDEQGEKRKRPKLRIGVLTSGLMVGLALIYDGAQALIELITFGLGGWIINPIINIWSLMTFYTWFKLNGISYNKLSKISTLGVPAFLEMLPLVGSLPTWTASVIISLSMTYAEDVVAKVSPTGAKALGSVLAKKPRLSPAPAV